MVVVCVLTIISTRARTEWYMMKRKQAHDRKRNAAHLTPDVTGMKIPPKIINSSATMSETRFTGVYIVRLPTAAAAPCLDVLFDIVTCHTSSDADIEVRKIN